MLSKFSNILSPIRVAGEAKIYAKVFHYLLILGLLSSIALGIFCTSVINKSDFANAFLFYISLSSLVLVISAYVLMVVFNSSLNSKRKADSETYDRSALLHELEELAIENRKLKKEKEIRDHLLRVVSHDIKSPIKNLEGIFGLALQGDMKSEVPTEMLIELSSATKYTSYIIDNLLLWTDARMVDQVQILENVSVKKLTDQILQESQFLSNFKKVKLVSTVSDDLIVKANYQTLWIVINNLIVNAIKFSKNNQQVRVSACMENDKIKIDVEDSGIGIPDILLERIFMPDLNKVRTGTRNEKGSGIGLILCKKLIESQNGTISVMSEVGQGSTFSVELPKA